MNTDNPTGERPATAAPSAELKERLVSLAMSEFQRALPTKNLPRGDREKVFRRWLDVIRSRATGQPFIDDDGAVLRRFGPPLAWFDTITNGGAWPRGMAADLDFFLERNGLFLVIEFKSSRGERGKGAGSNVLSKGQHRSLATLAKTGLFVVYVVEYSDAGGNEQPPVITRVRRLTDDVAPARRWNGGDFGDLLCLIHQWWANAGNPEFVWRQKGAAVYGQLLQLEMRMAAYKDHDSVESVLLRRAQLEALRLTQRSVREGTTPNAWTAFKPAFARKLEELLAGMSLERSTD